MVVQVYDSYDRVLSVIRPATVNRAKHVVVEFCPREQSVRVCSVLEQASESVDVDPAPLSAPCASGVAVRSVVDRSANSVIPGEWVACDLYCFAYKDRCWDHWVFLLRLRVTMTQRPSLPCKREDVKRGAVSFLET